MRWFKHMTNSSHDEKLSQLIDEGGLEAYGFWWRLLEIVAELMDNTEKCEATYSLPQWSRLFYCHHHTINKYFRFLKEIGLADVQIITQELPPQLPNDYPDVTRGSNRGVTRKYGNSNSNSKIIVTIPNLLKYRDEYSKKSGQTQNKNPDKRRSKKQIQKQNKDTDNNGTRKIFSPPSYEEVAAFCKERNRGVNPDKWYNHYQSNGWKVGKTKMVDWQAAIRTWEDNSTELPLKPRKLEVVL